MTLSVPGKVQLALGIIFFVLGICVIYSGFLVQFVGKSIIDGLTSPTFMSGMTISGLGLAFVSIAYTGEN